MSSDLSRQCLRLQEEQAFRKTHIKMVNRTRSAAEARDLMQKRMQRYWSLTSLTLIEMLMARDEPKLKLS